MVSEGEGLWWQSRCTEAGKAGSSNLDCKNRKQRKEKGNTGGGRSFWSLKAHPCDTPPPTRPHLLILPKLFHPLETKNWKYELMGGHSYSNYHTYHIFISSLCVCASMCGICSDVWGWVCILVYIQRPEEGSWCPLSLSTSSLEVVSLHAPDILILWQAGSQQS